jgi:hypothetical protein
MEKRRGTRYKRAPAFGRYALNNMEELKGQVDKYHPLGKT